MSDLTKAKRQWRQAIKDGHLDAAAFGMPTPPAAAASAPSRGVEPEIQAHIDFCRRNGFVLVVAREFADRLTEMGIDGSGVVNVYPEVSP